MSNNLKPVYDGNVNLKALFFFLGGGGGGEGINLKESNKNWNFVEKCSLILNKKLQDEKQLEPIILFLVALVLWSVKHAR